MSESNLSGQRDWYLHQYLCSCSAPSRPAFWKASLCEFQKYHIIWKMIEEASVTTKGIILDPRNCLRNLVEPVALD